MAIAAGAKILASGNYLFNHPFSNKCKHKSISIAPKAQKQDNNSSKEDSQFSLFNLKFSAPSSSPNLLVQSAIALFGLGFVDAGYSGDWSRIGAISKDSEEALKIWAFGVVPLCILLIYTLSAKQKES